MKPKPLGKFVISIADGFVEYSYTVMLPDSYSIVAVQRKIQRALKYKAVKGLIRR